MVSTTTASCPEAAATLAAMNGTIARSGSSRPWVQWNSSLAMSVLLVAPGRMLAGRGAKNSVPKVMVAALLTEDDCVIGNVPRIQDVDIVSDMLTVMGGGVAAPEPGTLRISTADVRPAGLDELKRFAGSSRIP